jgi:hypothetical protein
VRQLVAVLTETFTVFGASVAVAVAVATVVSPVLNSVGASVASTGSSVAATGMLQANAATARTVINITMGCLFFTMIAPYNFYRFKLYGEPARSKSHNGWMTFGFITNAPKFPLPKEVSKSSRFRLGD